MYTLDDLIYLMSRLRDPDDGCPWDLKQDYRTIVPSTIEEVYELVGAIENRDFKNLQEELGDLLFQVVFYSRLAEEEQRFNLLQVVDCLVEKLIRRHPHVFPGGNLQSRRDKSVSIDDDSIKQTWEQIKTKERNNKGLSGLLDDIPQALPAILRALKLQKRAAKVGFDWAEVSGVLEKVKEETAELEHAIATQKAEDIEDELGDLFFTCVSLARHLKVDPESSLRRASAKFQQRIQFVESLLSAEGKEIEKATTEELDSLWQQAKVKLVSDKDT